MQVHIINFPATRVAALEHHGPEHRTYDTTMKFIEWRQANRIGPHQGSTYGIHYTDPVNTFPENYRIDICVSVEDDIPENPQGVVNKVIPACRCAVARHRGSRAHVTAAEYLVFDWLPQSGEELGDFPIFFHYVNIGPDIRENDMITDVYLPLK
jgi:AraC family transcriptional regulator